jgi:hypothetical protein
MHIRNSGLSRQGIREEISDEIASSRFAMPVFPACRDQEWLKAKTEGWSAFRNVSEATVSPGNRLAATAIGGPLPANERGHCAGVATCTQAP